jgi:hypothetical protein
MASAGTGPDAAPRRSPCTDRAVSTRSGPWSMSALRQAERPRAYGIPSLGRPRGNQWHISKLSGWYKSLYRSHRGPLCKKDDVQKTFHQGSLLPRFPD